MHKQSRQLLLAVHLYGDDNEQRVPSGASNPPHGALDDHLPVISTATSNSFVQYLGNKRMVSCPSFVNYFTKNPQEPQCRGAICPNICVTSSDDWRKPHQDLRRCAEETTQTGDRVAS